MRKLLFSLVALALSLAAPLAEAQIPGIPQPVAQPRVLASCTFTRPANTTAYSSGDLVANSVTAGSVVPCSLTLAQSVNRYVTISRVAVAFNDTTLTNASFRVHLYNTCTITAANGDNGAWSTNKVANWVGAADVTVATAFTDGAKGVGIPNTGTQVMTAPTTGARTICALLEARAGYTPTSAEVFTISVEGLQN